MDKVLILLKGLADRNRLRILFALIEFDELCACQITELLQVSGATASRHLSILVSTGLLESRKDGRWVYYRLSSPDKDQKDLKQLVKWLKNAVKNSSDVTEDHRALLTIIAMDKEEICRQQRGEKCCPKTAP